MLKKPAIRRVFLLWLGWAVLLISFQALAAARFEPKRPDRVLGWTASLTTPYGLADQPYLNDPFMNNQVSWDSDMYLSIAVAGYYDTEVKSYPSASTGKALPLNYAFFPGYPYAARLLAFLLRIFNLTPIATATLGGVMVSLLGTLAGMFALYDLASRRLGEDGGLRAAFYLVIFPTGFFLAQVYSEGLFIGLAFGCLALLYRKQWLAASALAVLAVLTRSVGLALLAPLGLAWIQEHDWRHITWRSFTWNSLGKAGLVLAPAAAYLAWRFSELGRLFQVVEHEYFGRGLFSFAQSWEGWQSVFASLGRDNRQTTVYYALELGIILLSILGCFFSIRKYPREASFGLLVLVVTMTLGYPQSISRYMLVLPTTFLFLSRLGQNPIFDRLWSMASLLIMGMQVTLFTFNFWVA